MGTAGKKGKSKKGGKQTSSQAPAAQKLNHSLDIVDAFFKLKVGQHCLIRPSLPINTSCEEARRSNTDFWASC